MDAAAVVGVVDGLSDDARARLGASVRRDGGVLMVAVTAEASPFFKRALGLESVGDDELAAVVEHYRSLGCTSFGILLNDAVEADPAVLARHGFRRGPGSPKLWRPGGPAIHSSSLRVEVTTDGELVADLTTRGFGWGPHLREWCAAPVGQEGWTHHVAYDGGAPVGIASTRRCGRSAWFGNGATLEQARGRGVHAALIARRIADAADCDHLVVETGDPPNRSFRNLERLGFTQVHHRTNWLWAEPLQTGSRPGTAAT